MAKKASDEAIAEAYTRLRSVWKVGEELGMCGQSVHERLQKMGVDTSLNLFTREDESYLAKRYVLYRDAGMLQALADELGRTKQFICRKAKALGLTDPHAKKAASFWPDMPIAVAKPIFDDFKRSRLGVTGYCKKKHYNIQSFVDCMRRNFGTEYDEAIAAKTPKGKAYQRGRNFEYKVMKDMGARGYITLRSPASKSPADVYCIAKGQLVFIQCKLNGAFPVEEWNVFYDYCNSVSAVPIMAQKRDGGGILYTIITAKKDGAHRRQPMEVWTPPERV